MKGEVSELLKPRWKIESLYPGSPFLIGEVLSLDEDNNVWRSGNKILESNFPSIWDCPKVFRKLFWYEEREASEIEAITFVKILPDDIVERSGRYGKVEKWVTEKFHAVPEPQTLAYIIDYKPGYGIEGEQLYVDRFKPQPPK